MLRLESMIEDEMQRFNLTFIRLREAGVAILCSAVSSRVTLITLGCSESNEGPENMTFYGISYSVKSSRVYKPVKFMSLKEEWAPFLSLERANTLSPTSLWPTPTPVAGANATTSMSVMTTSFVLTKNASTTLNLGPTYAMSSFTLVNHLVRSIVSTMMPRPTSAPLQSSLTCQPYSTLSILA
ncbi:hypothetical protein LguiB_031371 [Lonicera macranthoides]